MYEAHQNFLAIWISAVTAIALVTRGRAVAIYPCCLLFSGSALRVTAKHQHVLFWGDCDVSAGARTCSRLPPLEIPLREEIITISFWSRRILRFCARIDDGSLSSKKWERFLEFRLSIWEGELP